MIINTKYLYELLPAYYRIEDEEQGKPLEAFIKILAREGGIVEESITQLYENWFIETCDEWVVPYIGDLLRVKNIHEIDDASVYSRRAYIANTLGYRRRKGTAPVLEQIAFDITGWRSKVVEFFQLLSTTQNLNHVRLNNSVTPDLRLMNNLDLINTAFDKQSHTIDVRRIETEQGLYNIMNIGLYLWRLQSYPLGDSYNYDPQANNSNNRYVDARKVGPQSGIPEGSYTFSPLGLDTHIFNRPQSEKEITHLAEEINVPGLLRRRSLHDELENARQSLVNGTTPTYVYFDNAYPPVFQIFINGSSTPVPREEIVICNLDPWHLPLTSKDYKKYEDDGTVSIIPKAITAAVDPVLGRITFANPNDISDVLINYSYGFSSDLGGGPYDRKTSLINLEELTFDWHVGVSKDFSPVQAETIYQSLQEAIDDWNGQVNKQVGIITIMDNRSYEKAATDDWKIEIPEGKRLYIIAAEWPEKDDPSGVPGAKYRPVGSYNPEDIRPHLRGDIEVEGTAPADSSSGGGLLVNGMLIEGKITVLNGNLSGCEFDHCTIVPATEGINVMNQDSILKLSLKQSICGPVTVSAEDASVVIEESIVDHEVNTAIDVPYGQLVIEKSTVFGKVEAQTLDASNSVFMNELNIEQRQVGCVRYSYMPVESKTPRRYRCQPELEINTQIKDLKESGPLSTAEENEIKEQILGWLFPVFNSNTYGHHAYAQLGKATPEQITSGGDNGSEMGTFNRLQQPQREANLKIVLKEYLNLGLEAGIIYVT